MEGLWEVGVEVAPDHRGLGLATCLTQRITSGLFRRGIVSFYSASATNVGSQRVCLQFSAPALG